MIDQTNQPTIQTTRTTLEY